MKCSFCGTNIERGTGKMLAKNDASIIYFCSNKCEKNLLKLNRNPRKFKWTEQFRKMKEKVQE